MFSKQLQGKFFIPHKYWELDFRHESPYCSYFSFMIDLDTKTDHAGLHFSLSLLGLSLKFDIYDNRHWDYKTNSWKIYQTIPLTVEK